MRTTSASLVSILLLAGLPGMACSQAPDPAPPDRAALDELASDFWAWRAIHQPAQGDDIPRIDRPTDWLPDWSTETMAARRSALDAFKVRLEAIDTAGWGAPHQVDNRLIGSALARVEWELDISPAWRRNPLFYVAQTQGSVFDLLLTPGPFGPERSTAIVRRMQRIPRTVEEAETNLDQSVRPFARLTIGELQGVRPRLERLATELAPHLTGPDASRLPEATRAAITALEDFSAWLRERLDDMPAETAVGRDAYVFFLKNVALLPFTPEELVSMARQEFDRAIHFEALEAQRNAELPQLEMFPDQAAQIAAEARREGEIREFLEVEGILTIPDWVQHYKNLPMPSYLAPLAHMGVSDDLTGPGRLDQNGISYIWPPSPNLGYFGLSTARDPRPIIVHEGVPGHYLQLVLSWAHENPIRRHYYDSGANEGIGFYAEEMMLQAGLFEDSPRTRGIIYNFMRLRALRVEVDVKLATGEFDIAEAGRYLEEVVPMPRSTAQQEAAFFASTPGQAISYQIGKLQITRMMSEARRILGDEFSVRDFHDFVWLNGNVPIALQRWEMLGLSDEIARLDSLP